MKRVNRLQQQVRYRFFLQLCLTQPCLEQCLPSSPSSSKAPTSSSPSSKAKAKGKSKSKVVAEKETVSQAEASSPAPSDDEGDDEAMGEDVEDEGGKATGITPASKRYEDLYPMSKCMFQWYIIAL